MSKKAFIPISALMGALLLALVAAMTPFVAEPDRAYAQALSADATLDGLTVVGGPSGNVVTALAPTYSDDEDEYTVRIGFNDTGVVVTPTAGITPTPDDGNPANDQIIRVNGTVVASGSGHNVATAAGQTTTISIAVTAPQRTVTKTFTVKVYRERSTKSTNANLSSLGISPGSLSPAFSSGTTSYKARVQAGEVTLNYGLSDTAGGASAAITSSGSGAVDGMKVPLDDAAAEGAATGGITTITVTVNAEADDSGGTRVQKVYTIEVYRIRANPSDVATLSGFSLTPTGGSDINTGFAVATKMYDLNVDNNVGQVTVAATESDAGAHHTISPSDADGNMAGHQVNLSAGGDTTITVRVTAEDPAATDTYTAMVYRKRATVSTNATLAALSLSSGTLSPAFRSSVEGYTAQVASDVKKVTVSYTPTDNAGGVGVVVNAATFSGDTSTITPAYDSDKKEVTLDGEGVRTDITLALTAEDGSTTKTYTITVYRLRALPSADTSLSGLVLTPTSGTALTTPAYEFATGTKMYNVTVAHNEQNITVAPTATAAANGATYSIMPADADNADGHQVSLAAGAKTRITVTVTAEDGMTTDTYTVYVYRQRATLSTEATLSALSLSDGMLSPAFMSDRMEYTARVGSDVDKVTVSYTPTDNAGGANVVVATPAAPDSDNTCTTVTAAADDAPMLGSVGTQALICVSVTPEAGAGTDNVKTYQINVYRERRNLETDATLSAFTVQDASGAPSGTLGAPDAINLLATPDPDVGYRVRTVTVVATPTDSSGGAVATITSPADKNPNTAAHEIDLAAGAETMITVVVQAEDPSTPTRTYMASVYRQSLSRSDDATLSSLMLSGVTLMYTDDDDMDMSGFMSDVMAYTGDAASDQITVTAMANHLGAQSGITITPVDADANMDGHQVNLGVIGADVSITVQVKPESIDVGTAAGQLQAGTNDCAAVAANRLDDIECYTITVTRTEGQAPRDEAALTAMYDTNGTAGIQIDEAVQAVQDYAAGTLTIEEIVIIVGLYATGG